MIEEMISDPDLLVSRVSLRGVSNEISRSKTTFWMVCKKCQSNLKLEQKKYFSELTVL
jgi:hypothetical protein